MPHNIWPQSTLTEVIVRNMDATKVWAYLLASPSSNRNTHSIRLHRILPPYVLFSRLCILIAHIECVIHFRTHPDNFMLRSCALWTIQVNLPAFFFRLYWLVCMLLIEPNMASYCFALFSLCRKLCRFLSDAFCLSARVVKWTCRGLHTIHTHPRTHTHTHIQTPTHITIIITIELRSFFPLPVIKEYA